MSEGKRKQQQDGAGANKKSKYFQTVRVACRTSVPFAKGPVQLQLPMLRTRAELYFTVCEQHKGAAIPLNSRGILVTCLGGKETPAFREALSVLTEYYEAARPSKAAADGSAGARDLSSELEQEIAQLKSRKDEIFVYHKTNVNGLIYVEMKAADGPGPVQLVASMAADVKATKQCKSRLCIRFIPVQCVCKASLPEIKKASEALIKAAFPAEEDATPVPYAVVYEHRASVTLDRMAVINAVVDHVPKVHKVNLKEPQKTILVQLIKSCCGLSVVESYKELNKFNMREMCMMGEEEDGQDKPAASKAEEPQAQPHAGGSAQAEAAAERTTEPAAGSEASEQKDAVSAKGMAVEPESAGNPSQPADSSKEGASAKEQ